MAVREQPSTVCGSRTPLTPGNKLAYGLGAVSDVIMANIIFQLALPIYNVGLKVNVVLIGFAVSLPRLWDAFSDPAIGSLSDNTRSRWGRRRPWLAWGAPAAGVLCALLWMPPAAFYGHEKLLFSYFLLLSILFFTAYAAFSVPYNALGFEMTQDYDERTSLMSWKTFMMNLGSMLLLPWVYKMCFIPAFGKNEIEGARVVGVLVGILIAVFGLLPAALCRESVKAQSQAKIRFFAGLKCTFKNRGFLIISGLVLTVILGIFLSFPLMFYINLAYIFDGNKAATASMMGWYNTVYGAAGVAVVPLINLLSRRYGKKETLSGGLSLIMVAFLLSPLLLNRQWPYLQLAFAVLASPGLSCVWVLTSSMLADVCDVDELETGLRREGMFSAAFAWLVKTGLASVMALSGYIVLWAHYNPDLAVQSRYTVLFLRSFFAATPLFILSLALALTFLFPLNRRKVLEVQRLLAARKSAADGDQRESAFSPAEAAGGGNGA